MRKYKVEKPLNLIFWIIVIIAFISFFVASMNKNKEITEELPISYYSNEQYRYDSLNITYRNQEDLVIDIFENLKSINDNIDISSVNLEAVDFKENILMLYFDENFEELTDKESIILKTLLTKTYTNIDQLEIEGLEIFSNGKIELLNEDTGESVLTQDNLSRLYKKNMIIKLYYLNKNNYLNNNIKSLDVVEEEIKVSENDNIEEIILRKLFEGPKDTSKYIDVIPNEAVINDVFLDEEEGMVTVDLSKEFKENQEFGSDAEIYSVYSIVNTLTELDYVEKIKLLIDGEEIKNLKHISVEDFYERDLGYLDKNE